MTACAVTQLRFPASEPVANVAEAELLAMRQAVRCGVVLERLPRPLPSNPRQLHAWLRSNIRLAWQPGRIQPPMRVIAEGETDCKGYAVLAAALGQRLGFPASGFAVMGQKGKHCFEHVVPVFANGFIVDAQAEKPGDLAPHSQPLCTGLWMPLDETSHNPRAGAMRGFSFNIGSALKPFLQLAQSTIGTATAALTGQAGMAVASLMVPGGGVAASIVAGTVNQTLQGGPQPAEGGLSLDQVAAWIAQSDKLPDTAIAVAPTTSNKLFGSEIKSDAAYIKGIPSMSESAILQRIDTAKLQIANPAGQPSGTNNPWTKIRAAILLAALQGVLSQRQNAGTAVTPPTVTPPIVVQPTPEMPKGGTATASNTWVKPLLIAAGVAVAAYVAFKLMKKGRK